MTEAPTNGAFDTDELLTVSEAMDEQPEARSPDERSTRRATPSLAERLRALEAFSAA